MLKGKQLFYDARDTRLAREGYLSCATLPQRRWAGRRVWDLTGFGEGLRNTVHSRASGGAQGFLHWSANFDEVQDFEGQIRALAGGTGLDDGRRTSPGTRSQPLGDPKAGLSADLDALAAYVASLNTFARSPHRNCRRDLDGAREWPARAVFQAKNCAQCHGGTGFTDSAAANLHDIGTLKPSSGGRLGGPLVGIDTPTLRDVWSAAPYLHDGSAATLAEAVRAHLNVTVSDAELTTLVAYLGQIDGLEPAPVPQRHPDGHQPADQVSVVGVPVSLQVTANDPENVALQFSAPRIARRPEISTTTGRSRVFRQPRVTLQNGYRPATASRRAPRHLLDGQRSAAAGHDAAGRDDHGVRPVRRPLRRARRR